MAAKRNLRDLTFADTVALADELGLTAYRARQMFGWAHHRAVESIDRMTDLPASIRERLAGAATIESVEIDLVLTSRDGTRKMRLRTHDNRFVESVLIPVADAEVTYELRPDAQYRGGRMKQRPFDRITQCVSSQVGCALDCTFCATATLGFGRQLTTGEIVSQIYRAQALLDTLDQDDPTRRAGGDRVTDLVFMGMGEPLHNYANVVAALRILTDERGPHFPRRRITVSTAGLVPAIEKLAREPVQVNLAVSLNATTDEVRNRLMPINRTWSIARLLEAVKTIPLDENRCITFEYVLLDGVNDSDDDAARLGDLLGGISCKVNLIPWNPHEHAPYRRPADARVHEFQKRVRAVGLRATIRRSRGDDVDAACGQLAAKQKLVSPSLIRR